MARAQNNLPNYIAVLMVVDQHVITDFPSVSVQLELLLCCNLSTVTVSFLTSVEFVASKFLPSFVCCSSPDVLLS